MHAFVLLPKVHAETHDRLVIHFRKRKAILAHERAEKPVDLLKRKFEMLRGGELKQHVMHQRCVDVGRRVWSAEPHA